MHYHLDITRERLTLSVFIIVKGYLRKATCHIAMKENSKAEVAYQKALELDPKCQVGIILL